HSLPSFPTRRSSDLLSRRKVLAFDRRAREIFFRADPGLTGQVAKAFLDRFNLLARGKLGCFSQIEREELALGGDATVGEYLWQRGTRSLHRQRNVRIALSLGLVFVGRGDRDERRDFK